jgi:hypothetical protein
MRHLRIWLLACMGWCIVWTLPAQASWEAYQQAGEEAYNRGDYATAQRMFLAAVREARNFGPQDPRLDISLSKLELLRITQGVHNEADVHTPVTRQKSHVTRQKSHTRKSGSVRRGRRPPAHSGLRHAKPGRQRHTVQSTRPGERRKGTRTTVERSTPRAKRSRATSHHARPTRQVAPPVHHGKQREALQTPRRQRKTPQRQRETPRLQRETPRRQQSPTLQRSRTTHHHTGKTTGQRSPARGRHK